MTLVGGIENIQASSGGTVTNTGGPLALNAVVLGAGANDEKTTPNFITDGTHILTVGVAGGGNGTLALSGNTSGTATIVAPAVAGTVLNSIVVSNSIQSAGQLAAGGANTVGGAVGDVIANRNSITGVLFLGGGGNALIDYNLSVAVQFSFTGGGINLQSGNFKFNGGKGQHFTNQAANSDMAGTFTVSASTTASVTFTTAYTSTPVVVLTPQTTGLTSWFLSAVSTTGFTVTVAPSGTYTFGYITVGNPT